MMLVSLDQMLSGAALNKPKQRGEVVLRLVKTLMQVTPRPPSRVFLRLRIRLLTYGERMSVWTPW